MGKLIGETIQAHINAVTVAMAAEKAAGYPSQKSYLQQVQPTYIEAWSAGLCSLSIAQVDIPLTLAEANIIGSHMMEFSEGFEACGAIDGLVHRVNDAVRKFPKGAFIRLGSRSPKDSWLAGREGSMCILPVEGDINRNNSPLRFMLDASERMYEDLTLAIQSGYEPHLFVRQWIPLSQWQEFRCFMRGRKLVGISQYYYRDGVLPEIVQNADVIQWVIEQFFDDFRKECHLDDVVFDVFVTKKTRGNENSWEVTLLEINPFFQMTDPCLFDWRKDGESLDGSFRFHRE